MPASPSQRPLHARARAQRLVWTLVGLAAFALSILAFPVLVKALSRKPLVVSLSAPDVSPGPHFDIGDALVPGQMRINGQPISAALPDVKLRPELHILEWAKGYRGGHERRVGHAQLVGPFQDPAAPPCSIRVRIGQKFLDRHDDEAGDKSPGSDIASIIGSMLGAQLQGFSQWPVGRFKRIEDPHLHVRSVDELLADAGENEAASSTALPKWLRRLREKDEGPKANGYLQLQTRIHFSSARIPLRVFVLPRIDEGQLRIEVHVKARLKLESRLYQWASDLFDGDSRLSTLIEVLVTEQMSYVLATPPPIALGGDASVNLAFCSDRDLDFRGQTLSVPMAIALDSEATIHPPLVPSLAASLPPMEVDVPVAVDIDENGLNALMHRLWSEGLLDQHVSPALSKAFNEQETVRDLLSLRLHSTQFHLPPTLAFSDESPNLRLRAAAKLRLTDGELATEGRLFSEMTLPTTLLSVGLKTPGLTTTNAIPDIHIDRVELSCAAHNKEIRACYTSIIEQVRANRTLLQGELTRSFRRLLNQVLLSCVIQPGPEVPFYFVLTEASLSRQGSWLHAALRGQVGESSD